MSNHRHPNMGNIERKLNIMSQELDRLTQSVSDLRTVDQSAETLLTGLSTLLRNALNGPNPTVALGKIADDIDADKTEMAAAITANTPAATAPAPTPTPTPPAV